MRAFISTPLRCCLLAILLVLPGCSIHSGPTNMRGVALKEAPPLPANASVYVAMPADFSGAAGSGQKTQAVFLASLNALPVKTVAAALPQNLPEAAEKAAASGCAYLLTVRINTWEDPPASFQISPDRGAFLVNIYALPELQQPYRSDSLECSGWATTVNLIGAYDPGDCLKIVLQGWRKQAFGR